MNETPFYNLSLEDQFSSLGFDYNELSCNKIFLSDKKCALAKIERFPVNLTEGSQLEMHYEFEVSCHNFVPEGIHILYANLLKWDIKTAEAKLLDQKTYNTFYLPVDEVYTKDDIEDQFKRYITGRDTEPSNKLFEKFNQGDIDEQIRWSHAIHHGFRVRNGSHF